MISSEEKVKIITDICEELKAVDIKIYDMREKSGISDFYVVCTGNSEPHLKAIATKVHMDLKKMGMDYKTVDADEESNWVVQDYSDVILHIFHPDARRHFNIEEFWNSDLANMPWDCPEAQILRDELVRRSY